MGGISSHQDEDPSINTEAISIMLSPGPDSTQSSGEVSAHRVLTEDYTKDNEEELLAFEDANEITDNSMEEFGDRDSGTEHDYYLELEDDRNMSYSGGFEDSDIITTGEFGVVFADQDPNDADDIDPDIDGSELVTGEPQWELDDSLNSEPPESMKTSLDTKMPDMELLNPTSAPKETAEMIFSFMKRNTNFSNPHCAMETQFHSWEKGMVTQLGKPLKRDCHKLRVNPQAEVRKVKLQSQVKTWKSTKPWESFAVQYREKGCDYIRHEFDNNFYISEVEKNFPIAYMLVVYINAGQVIRLLKSIYRPHNLYCIHPDTRQGEVFASFFRTIAKCFDNVFIVSKPVRVYYGHISITDSQLHCMQDLMTYPATRWKYVINLCGREVPLKTNREIVESLEKLKGYTALNLRHLTPFFWRSRLRFKFHLNHNGHMWQTRQRQSRPPPGIKLYKSMNFMAASRAFVNFLLHNPLSIKLRRYLGTVYAPEEHFYSSLYALPQAKGARPPEGAVQHSDMPLVDEFIWINTKWQARNGRFYCPGQRRVHGICILTAPDLGRIEKLGIHSTKPVFFFNKYFLEWDPTAMDCMEERLVSTNIDEYWHDCVTSHRV